MGITDWLPRNRVHLLAGESDAAKTRFVLPAMLEQSPNWAYVSGDRSRLDAEDTIHSLGYNVADVPLIPAFGPERKGLNGVLDALTILNPKPEYVIWEGFQRLCADANRKHLTEAFLSAMDTVCRPNSKFPNGLTILGVCESPKQKPHERYRNPRSRVAGSATWGYAASTVILIDNMPRDWAFEIHERVLWVCLKNAPRLKLHLVADERGRYLIVP